MVDIRASRAITETGFVMPVEDKVDQAQIDKFLVGQTAIINLTNKTVADALSSKQFELRASFFTELHKAGYDNINNKAGFFRTGSVFVDGSNLVPPPANEVEELMDNLCDYINDNWDYSTIFHLGAYLMWRLLWIHPFLDGNGTIARAATYAVMEIKNGCKFQGRKHMFEVIADRRNEYYHALSKADSNWSDGYLDLRDLEEFLRLALAVQTSSVDVVPSPGT